MTEDQLLRRIGEIILSGPPDEALAAVVARIRAWLQLQRPAPLPAHSLTANRLTPIDDCTLHYAFCREILAKPEVMACVMARLIVFCDELTLPAAGASVIPQTLLGRPADSNIYL